MKDPHAVLGVSRQASPEEIKAAFRRLALQYHPDRNPGDQEAEERFKEISAAHQELTKPQQRRSPPPPPPPPREPPPPPPCCQREVFAACSCGHPWGAHMGFHPHPCIRLDCSCAAFGDTCCKRPSEDFCTCGHAWGRHRRGHPHPCADCLCPRFSEKATWVRIFFDGKLVHTGVTPKLITVVIDGEPHEIHPRAPGRKVPWWELEVRKEGVRLGNTTEFRAVLRALKTGNWTPTCYECEEVKRKIGADRVDWEFFPETRGRDKNWRPPPKMRERMR